MLAVVLVVLPVGWLLARCLSWRLRWAREATAAGCILAGNAGLDRLGLLLPAPDERVSA